MERMSDEELKREYRRVSEKLEYWYRIPTHTWTWLERREVKRLEEKRERLYKEAKRRGLVR